MAIRGARGDEFELRCVASAIRRAWEKCGEVPFPLYESEAEELARAAIAAIYRPAVDEIERLRADRDYQSEWCWKWRNELIRCQADKAELLAALQDVSSIEGTEGITDAHFVERALVIVNAAIDKVSK